MVSKEAPASGTGIAEAAGATIALADESAGAGARVAPGETTHPARKRAAIARRGPAHWRGAYSMESAYSFVARLGSAALACVARVRRAFARLHPRALASLRLLGGLGPLLLGALNGSSLAGEIDRLRGAARGLAWLAPRAPVGRGSPLVRGGSVVQSAKRFVEAAIVRPVGDVRLGSLRVGLRACFLACAAPATQQRGQAGRREERPS